MDTTAGCGQNITKNVKMELVQDLTRKNNERRHQAQQKQAEQPEPEGNECQHPNCVFTKLKLAPTSIHFPPQWQMFSDCTSLSLAHNF